MPLTSTSTSPLLSVRMTCPCTCVYGPHETWKAGSRRCATVCLACAEFDASVMLVRNTPWARGFFRKAHQAQQRPAAMASVLAEDIRLHGERNATLEQVTCPACSGSTQTSAICRSVHYVPSYVVLTPASGCCSPADHPVPAAEWQQSQPAEGLSAPSSNTCTNGIPCWRRYLIHTSHVSQHGMRCCCSMLHTTGGAPAAQCQVNCRHCAADVLRALAVHGV